MARSRAPNATAALGTGDGTFRFEAEAFAGVGEAGNFRAKRLDGASGGRVVQLAAEASGSIEADLGSLPPGQYTLCVTYFDETDGSSAASLLVGGATVAAWSFDGVAGDQVQPGAPTGGGAQPGNIRSFTVATAVTIGPGTVLTLRATRDGGESVRIDFVELVPLNRAPTAIGLAATSVPEGAAGSAIGLLTVTDPDAGDTHAFGTDDARFVVVDGVLRLAPGVALDFEATPSVRVDVTATDPGGLSVTERFIIAVQDRAPDIVWQSLDGPLPDDRLVFSHLETTDGRADKSEAVLRISNAGADTLLFDGLTLSGPFAFAGPTPTSLAPGATIDLRVMFDRSAYDPDRDPDIFTGALTIRSDDPDQPVVDIPLAGFWQIEPEKGKEPDVNELAEVFGLGNRFPLAALDNFDVVEAVTPQEVLAPAWQRAEGYAEITLTWLASYHGKVPTTIALHEPGDKTQRVALLTQAADQNQTLLPRTAGGETPIVSFGPATIPNGWPGADVFSLLISEESGDPSQNDPGPGEGPPGAERGYFLRAFAAIDADGVAIADTYLFLHDYNSRGVNYDFNDQLVLVRGITPVFDLDLI